MPYEIKTCWKDESNVTRVKYQNYKLEDVRDPSPNEALECQGHSANGRAGAKTRMISIELHECFCKRKRWPERYETPVLLRINMERRIGYSFIANFTEVVGNTL